jgi:hypothetical protein
MPALLFALGSVYAYRKIKNQFRERCQTRLPACVAQKWIRPRTCGIWWPRAGL